MAGLDAALNPAAKWLEKNILIDTVRLTLPGVGEPVFNPETGQVDYPQGDTLYEGPGAVVSSSGTTERAAATEASQQWPQQRNQAYFLLTPLAAPIPPEYAVVSVVAVHDATRTSLLGRTWQCSSSGLASTVEVVRKTPLDQNVIPPGVEGGGQ